MRFFLDECVHFLSALLIGLTVWALFGQWRLVLVSLSFGFLIDADHLFDYFHHFGLKRLVLKDFFEGKTYINASHKAYVPLHGWEYLILFWVLASLLPRGVIDGSFSAITPKVTARAAFSIPKKWTNERAPIARAAAASLVDMLFLRILDIPGFSGSGAGLHFIHFAAFTGAHAFLSCLVHALAHIGGAVAAKARQRYRV